jgi:hypothetical protein
VARAARSGLARSGPSGPRADRAGPLDIYSAV